jgi:ABC-type antimicrobial peptide transport system permease subunit
MLIYFVINAAKNIIRYKNKYILFGCLFSILIFTASVCVNVFIRMDAVTDNILREYAGVSKIELSSDDLYELKERITKEQYLNLKNINYISDIRFLKYNFYTDYIKQDVSELKVTAGDTAVHDSVIIFGYNTSLLHLVPEDFDLESGRMFEIDGECVISKNPSATDEASVVWNNVKIGDVITIQNSDGVFKQFTVVGVQKQNEEDKPNTNRRIIYTTLEDAEYFDSIAYNHALAAIPITPIEITADMRLYPGDEGFEAFFENLNLLGYEVLVYLDSPETFLNLSSRLDKIEINNVNLRLKPFFTNFYGLVNLTNAMRQSSAGFSALIAFIIICVTIITTIILLSSRKYEMAVLRSVGMKKIRLILFYLIENLIFILSITTISLIIAQFIGPIFTKETLEGMRKFVSTEMYETLTSSSNISLLFKNIGIVYGGMTAAAALSLILTCVNIIKFEPMKIFNKQY